eukprot:scaffold4233_cov153-Pinguiococcus_pyrenoidosus.AAC.4
MDGHGPAGRNEQGSNKTSIRSGKYNHFRVVDSSSKKIHSRGIARFDRVAHPRITPPSAFP